MLIHGSLGNSSDDVEPTHVSVSNLLLLMRAPFDSQFTVIVLFICFFWLFNAFRMDFDDVVPFMCDEEFEVVIEDVPGESGADADVQVGVANLVSEVGEVLAETDICKEIS